MFIELDHKVNEICLMYEIIAGQIISSDQVKNIIQNITKKQIDYYIL
jgi:hypothetical protein